MLLVGQRLDSYQTHIHFGRSFVFEICNGTSLSSLPQRMGKITECDRLWVLRISRITSSAVGGVAQRLP